MSALAALVAAALPEVAVDVGFLEMRSTRRRGRLDDWSPGVSEAPRPAAGAARSRSRQERRPSGGARSPRTAPGGRDPFGRPLGVSRAPVEVLGQAVRAAGGAGLPLARGGSGHVGSRRQRRGLQGRPADRRMDRRPVRPRGFQRGDRPVGRQAAEVFSRLGYRRMAVAWWYLCHGKLIEQGRLAGGVPAVTGVEVVDAGHIGPHPDLVPLVVERYRRRAPDWSRPTATSAPTGRRGPGSRPGWVRPSGSATPIWPSRTATPRAG